MGSHVQPGLKPPPGYAAMVAVLFAKLRFSCDNGWAPTGHVLRVGETKSGTIPGEPAPYFLETLHKAQCAADYYDGYDRGY